MEENICIPSVDIKHNDAPMLTTSVLSHAEEDVKKAGELFRYFNTLDVTGHIEKKNGLSYLSWPFAVQEARRKCPDFSFSIQTFNGYPYQFDPKTGYMVYTTVTMGGVTIPMWLPVMDSSNKAMKDVPYEYEVYDKFKKQYTKKKVEAATMFEINKTIMRCLVKNLAMFGLGLYVYAGEDIPSSDEESAKPKRQQASIKSTQQKLQTQQQPTANPHATLIEKINSTNDVAALVSIYLDNTQVIEANSELKSLLTNRKKALQTLNAA